MKTIINKMLWGKEKFLYLLVLSGILSYSCKFQDKDDVPEVPDIKKDLVQVATSSRQWTGVAVSREGRIFVNYPNWKEGHSFSVGELTDSIHVKQYPNEIWNLPDSTQSPQNRFICVQAVHIDTDNFLWVLDPANPQRNGKYLGVVPGGAKLVKIDIQTNTVVKTILFDAPVITGNSYLNDIRIDEEKGIGYITDSNEGAIVVVDLHSGRARRIFDKDPVTKSENRSIVVEGILWRQEDGKIPSVHADGIALSEDEKFLYWRPLSGTSFYRIQTSSLLDTMLTDSILKTRVEFLGNLPPSDGMIAGKDGAVYLTSIEENAIRKYTGAGFAPVVAVSTYLKWPDSFSHGPDGYIYVTAAQLHLKNPAEPYKLFKFKQ